MPAHFVFIKHVSCEKELVIDPETEFSAIINRLRPCTQIIFYLNPFFRLTLASSHITTAQTSTTVVHDTDQLLKLLIIRQCLRYT